MSFLEDEDDGPERRSGLTLTRNTTIAISVTLLAQFIYVAFTMGRQSEKLDNVVTSVNEIKAAQYTQRDAERDIGPLRRDQDRLEGRIRALEQASDHGRAGR